MTMKASAKSFVAAVPRSAVSDRSSRSHEVFDHVLTLITNDEIALDGSLAPAIT